MEIAILIGSAVTDTFLQMAPYLLFGLSIAGVLHVLFSPAFVYRMLGKRGIGSVVKAALIGVPLPLCSCGVLPMALSLRKSGASKGATVSFLISTPQTGVDSMIATYGMLGLPFAVFRPIAAFMMGIVGGLITEAFGTRMNAGATAEPQPNFSCTLCPVTSPHSHSLREKVHGMIRYAGFDFLDTISLHLVIGIIVAGLIAFLVPNDLFSKYLHNDFLSMLVMIVVGAPLYICATASIPIAAALMLKGASAGAAFVFLTVGPATNAAAILLIGHALGKRTATIYLMVIAGLSMIAGYALNFVVSLTHYALPMAALHHHHGHSAGPISLTLSGIFLLLLVLSLFRTNVKPWVIRLRRRLSGESASVAQTYCLTVSGMSCGKCARKVTNAALAVAGVSDVAVDLDTKTAKISGSADIDKVKIAIIGAGYGVT